MRVSGRTFTDEELDALAGADFVEAAAAGMYGSNWNGPPDKRPGEKMKEVWRDYARRGVKGAGVADLLDAIRFLRAGGWRPIETAPKDETTIQVFDDGLIFTAYWDDEYWKSIACADSYFGTDSATHWRPLPPAPEAT
jgi:hypothetical protein